MPRAGFEFTTHEFQRAKTVDVSDRTATVIGLKIFLRNGNMNYYF
jgi:hypothetical protein